MAAAEEEGEEGAGAGVEGFPEVGAEVAVLKKTKTKNINMEAAMLHAVTDLVSRRTWMLWIGARPQAEVL